MKKLPIVKSITRALRNKTILERSGIPARAYTAPTSAHVLEIFPDTMQANTFIQDYSTLFPEKSAFLLNELPKIHML